MATQPPPADVPHKSKWQSIREKPALLGGLLRSWSARRPRFIGISASRIRNLIATQITLHPKLYLVFQIIFLGWSLLWWRYPPAPGKAVLLLAVVAAIVTIQPQMTDNHRLAWLVIVFVLFFVEFRAIDRDRDQHENQQANLRQEEKNHFDTIVTNLSSLVMQNQQQFLVTMDRTETIVGLEKSAIVGLSENIKTMTGGDSYCSLITLQSLSNSVPLYV